LIYIDKTIILTTHNKELIDFCEIKLSLDDKKLDTKNNNAITS